MWSTSTTNETRNTTRRERANYRNKISRETNKCAAGFNPGGGSDTLAQITQPTLEKILGQSFVNSIPGATGAIAWTNFASRQSPMDTL